jgi:MOSC domain-containing protein YiiM
MCAAAVTHLLLKPSKREPLVSVAQLDVDASGIRNNVPCLPLRQILIVPSNVLTKWHLEAGDLRENVVVDFDALHDLESGTAIALGEVNIRLTFHCEPCARIADKVRPRDIAHRRGVLGSFLGRGTIRVGDAVRMTEMRFEPIPYEIPERLKWFLDKLSAPVRSDRLLHELGLSSSYARALPRLLAKLPARYSQLVEFKTRPVLRGEAGLYA